MGDKESCSVSEIENRASRISRCQELIANQSLDVTEKETER